MSKPTEQSNSLDETSSDDEEEEYEEEEEEVVQPTQKIVAPTKILKPTVFFEDGKPSSQFRLELFEDLTVILIQQEKPSSAGEEEKSHEFFSKTGTWVSSKIGSSAANKWTSCIGIRWSDATSSGSIMPVNVSENGLLILNNERTFITLQY
jgi:hypothetical protein